MANSCVSPFSSDHPGCTGERSLLRRSEIDSRFTQLLCANPSSLLTGSYVMATAEQREPYESRGSRTVLGEPGGESPPGHSTKRDGRSVLACGGFYVTFWAGLWAPKGTPKDVIARLNSAAVTALADPTVRTGFTDLGLEIYSRDQQTAEVLTAYQKTEIEKWWPIIKAAGIKVG
jgi:hypothetical protein